jgi:hypothetical protein
VVEATGATLLSSLSESDVSDPTKTKVITRDPSTPAQRLEKGVKRVTRLGVKLFPATWLFHVIITQFFSTEAGQELHASTTPRQKRKAIGSLPSDEDMAKSSRTRKAVESPPRHGERRKSSRKR